MNNQEKIRRAFDPLQPSPEFSVEGNMMNRKSVKKPVLVLCAALVLVLAGITAAYASDLGGFRETLTFWFSGKQHTAEVVQDEDGVVTWTDGEGNSHSMGGIAFDENGNPRTMTAEELIQAELSGRPVLDLFPDGTVFLTGGPTKDGGYGFGFAGGDLSLTGGSLTAKTEAAEGSAIKIYGTYNVAVEPVMASTAAFMAPAAVAPVV